MKFQEFINGIIGQRPNKQDFDGSKDVFIFDTDLMLKVFVSHNDHYVCLCFGPINGDIGVGVNCVNSNTGKDDISKMDQIAQAISKSVTDDMINDYAIGIREYSEKCNLLHLPKLGANIAAIIHQCFD